jgi:uncharacterized membrane protein
MQPDLLHVDPLVLAAIAGMAAATYFTRFIGYWLVRHRPVSGRLAGALEAVPGALLTAIIAPMALATGPAETAAATLTVLLALRLPLVVAVAGGCLAVVVLRAVLG